MFANNSKGVFGPRTSGADPESPFLLFLTHFSFPTLTRQMPSTLYSFALSYMTSFLTLPSWSPTLRNFLQS